MTFMFADECCRGVEPGRRTARQRNRLLLASVACLFMANAAAVDLSWQPQLRVGTRATDNLRTSLVDKEAAWGFDTGASVLLKAEADTWRSIVTPTFNIRRFVIGEDADAEEYNVRTQNQWAFIENANATFDLDYIKDSTLSTDTTDDGLINDVTDRETINIRPGFNFLLDERTALNAGFYYSDVSFEEGTSSGYVDYDYKQVNVGATHAYSEALTFFVSGFVSEFRAPDLQGKSITYGGQGGLTYRYSETLDADFAVGYSQSDIDFVEQRFAGFEFVGFDPVTGQPQFRQIFTFVNEQTTENGPIASVSIRKNLEWLSARLDYNRAVSPSTRGSQTIADDILLTLEHDVSDRLLVGFRGSYNMRSSEVEDVVNLNTRSLNRDQVIASPFMRYRFTEQIALSASYRFLWNQHSDPDRNIYNNTVFVTLNYNGEPNFYHGF